MKIVFMGTPDYATKIFEAIYKQDGMDVTLVVTQMDKPVGRKMQLTPPHIKSYILENGLDVEIYQPKNLRNEEAYETIKSHNPDFIVVAAYGHILPENILQIAPCINLHASILPAYRGSSPIQASILNNDKYAGVTSMLMAKGLDTGDMLGFSYVELEKDILVNELFDTLSIVAAKLCIKTLERFENIAPLAQKSCDATQVKKIIKEDGLLNLENSHESYTKYRAFCGWPGVYLENGLKIKKMKMKNSSNSHESGKILAINEKSLIVGCKSGELEIFLVQQPSKKEIDAVSFARGKRLQVGDSIF